MDLPARLVRRPSGGDRPTEGRLAPQCNAVPWFSEDEARERVSRILDDGSITTVFQPIVDLSSGDVVGAEALTRFDCDPRRTPDMWFREAFAVGLGQPLEQRAVASAVDRMPEIPGELFLGLNVSPTMATSDWLARTLVEAEPARVILEVTEHAPIRDYDSFNESLASVRKAGVRLAIDDVGAGFSNFSRILYLEPDILKLDVSVTRGIDHDAARQALTSALVAFGKRTRAQLVAEGVETGAELNTLSALGVDWAQGYYLATPASPPPCPGPLSASMQLTGTESASRDASPQPA